MSLNVWRQLTFLFEDNMQKKKKIHAVKLGEIFWFPSNYESYAALNLFIILVGDGGRKIALPMMKVKSFKIICLTF